MKSHWAHHKQVRTQAYRDDAYEEGFSNWRTRNEVKSLLVLTAGTTLLFPVAPFFTLGTYYAAANYYYVHRRSHMDPEWGRKRIPWHFDHHMNTNQDANWCVTRPWFDYLMGTRVVSSPELMESNPLGIKLPKFVEKRVNAAARRLLPRAFARLDENRVREASARARGLDQAIPEVGQAA
jgi:sterol desaturase/sphingolipid hydroxylase (fatty acid hydroxylase superfamily)